MAAVCPSNNHSLSRAQQTCLSSSGSSCSFGRRSSRSRSSYSQTKMTQCQTIPSNKLKQQQQHRTLPKIFTTTTTTIVGLFIIILQLTTLLDLTTPCSAARTRLRNILEAKYNVDCHLPQCKNSDPDKSAVNLFQVISSNPELSTKTNFIWSNIGGPPMVITTSSSQDSSLHIDWESILQVKQQNANSSSSTTNGTTGNNNTPHLQPDTSGFHFNITPEASIGLLVEKIILFDDTNKDGAFTPDKRYVEIDWGQIVWDAASKATYHKDDFLKTFLRMKSNHKYWNGNLLIKLAIPRDYKADRQKEVPHLKLNSHSISVVIMVDGMQAPKEFQNPRLAMTFVVVVQSSSKQVALDTESESLISDEYTPGVFRIKSLQFKAKPDQVPAAEPSVTLNNNLDAYATVDGTTEAPATPTAVSVVKDKLGFLYWKEVAYTDRRKIISRTIDVFDSELKMPLDNLPNISQPFYQFFKYEPSTGPKPEYKLFRFELIFGKGDSTYGSTNFTDFSFVFGLGVAPQEQIFSFLVKFIIFVCFCLPLLVMLAGLVYLMLRKFRRNGDTELLLAAES